MRRLLILLPLAALLAASLWFAGRAWIHLAGDAIPPYGLAAMAGGIVLSLVVGCGLMALMFYSHRHGYDDLNEKDRGNEK